MKDVSECDREYRSRLSSCSRDWYVVVFFVVSVFLSDHLRIDTLFVEDDLLAVLAGPFDMSTS